VTREVLLGRGGWQLLHRRILKHPARVAPIRHPKRTDEKVSKLCTCVVYPHARLDAFLCMHVGVRKKMRCKQPWNNKVLTELFTLLLPFTSLFFLPPCPHITFPHSSIITCTQHSFSPFFLTLFVPFSSPLLPVLATRPFRPPP